MMQKPSPLRLTSRSQLLTAFSSLYVMALDPVRRMGSSLRGRTVWAHRHTARGPCIDNHETQDCWLTWTCHGGSELPPSNGQRELSQDLRAQGLWSPPKSTQPFRVKTKHAWPHLCSQKGGFSFINLRGTGCIRKDKCFGLKLILLLFMKGGHWAYSSRHCGPYDSFTPHTLTASSVGQGSLTTQLWEATFSRYSFYSLGCKGFMKTKRHPPRHHSHTPLRPPPHHLHTPLHSTVPSPAILSGDKL